MLICLWPSPWSFCWYDEHYFVHVSLVTKYVYVIAKLSVCDHLQKHKILKTLKKISPNSSLIHIEKADFFVEKNIPHNFRDKIGAFIFHK